jgi:hypothetical protein
VAQHSLDLVQVLPDLGFRQAYWIVTHLDVRDVRRIKEVQRFIAASVKSNSSVFA